MDVDPARNRIEPTGVLTTEPEVSPVCGADSPVARAGTRGGQPKSSRPPSRGKRPSGSLTDALRRVGYDQGSGGDR